MQLRWEALGEAEVAVEENVIILELTGIDLSVQQIKLGSALAFLREGYTEEDREEADLTVHFQTPEEPIRMPDVRLGSLHPCRSIELPQLPCQGASGGSEAGKTTHVVWVISPRQGADTSVGLHSTSGDEPWGCLGGPHFC